jgi:hypothetical protein
VRTSGQDFYKAILYYENCPFATVFCGVVFPGARVFEFFIPAPDSNTAVSSTDLYKFTLVKLFLED